MNDLDVADQPLWPKFQAAMRPAKLSFRLVMTTTDEKMAWDVPEKQFRFDGFKARAQLEARVEVPSLGFSWTSESLQNSSAEFAIIGNEVNGKYYSH